MVRCCTSSPGRVAVVTMSTPPQKRLLVREPLLWVRDYPTDMVALTTTKPLVVLFSYLAWTRSVPLPRSKSTWTLTVVLRVCVGDSQSSKSGDYPLGINQYIEFMLFLFVSRVGDTHHFNTYGYKIGKHKYMSEDQLNDVQNEVIFDMKIDQKHAFKIVF